MNFFILNRNNHQQRRTSPTALILLWSVLLTLNLSSIISISSANTLPASVPLSIFNGALQSGFSTNQWQDGTNNCVINLNNTQYPLNGKASAELNLNHYCTVFFIQPGHYNVGVYVGGFDVSSYSYLEFDMYAAPPAQATFGIALAASPDNWDTIGTQVLIESYVKPAGKWQHVKIPTKDFNVAPGTLIEGFQLRNNDWQTNSNVYSHVLLNNISFTPNLNAPKVASISSTDLKHIKVTYNKQVDPTSATTLANYAISSTLDNSYSRALTPQSASISSDNLNVILTTPHPLQTNALYSLSLKNITDRLKPKHSIAANSTTNFTAIYSPLTININAARNKHPISPYIYGLAFAPATSLTDLNFTLNRQGGNRASTYNYQTNASNHANDYYFESLPEDGGTGAAGLVDSLISDNQSSGADSIITIPTIGWIAKLGANRSGLPSYSQKKYGVQTGSDYWLPDAGNGILKNTGLQITGNDPNDAYVPSSTKLQSGLVNHLISKWGTAHSGGVKFYAMDNEPGIWTSTHSDIIQTGPKMSETLNDILAYGEMVKWQDPSALVLAPEEDGWARYLVSGYDNQWANLHNDWSFADLPDRNANGGMDYIPWLLKQIQQNDSSTGIRTLDVLTLHWYPQSGEYTGSSNDDISPRMMQIRNRSTRSLWDANYVDESWVGGAPGGGKVYLIPRMKQWVNQYYPGTKVGITEYSWGAETNINGATTEADILGIFGREGLDLATYWTAPKQNTPAYLAMKMYRNYDNAKSTFGDISVSDIAPNPDKISSFAAMRTADQALTLMVINKQLSTDTSVLMNVKNFTGTGVAHGYQLTASGTINKLSDSPYQNGKLEAFLPAQSITLFVLPSVKVLTNSQVNTSISKVIYNRTQQTKP